MIEVVKMACLPQIISSFSTGIYEYMMSSLARILQYIDNGGTDLNVIHAEVYDAIYESRI
ncbi:hypothetical protein [Enterococcus cecorum]|uniref:hypothetical protein n=1 Tax=Enterococcus cecorum TaxID=44008 RepID=UPI0032C43C26